MVRPTARPAVAVDSLPLVARQFPPNCRWSICAGLTALNNRVYTPAIQISRQEYSIPLSHHFERTPSSSFDDTVRSLFSSSGANAGRY